MSFMFKDFPEEVLKYIEIECIRQNSTLDRNQFCTACNTTGGFNWDQSNSMSIDFWDKFLCGFESMDEAVAFFNNNIVRANYPELHNVIVVDNIPNVSELGTVYKLEANDGSKYEVTIKKIN